MKHWYLYLNVLVLTCWFCFSTTLAQTVTISGVVQLEGQSDNSSVLITFNRTAPSALTHNTLSNSDGTFTLTVESGLYNISYTKSGYFSATLSQINCFSNVTLATQTLNVRSSRINVPTDHALIQQAIDDSFTGDTIIVSRGVYTENLNMNGKAVTLSSEFIFTKDTADISNTIIDGNKLKTVIICSNYETNTTVISGLTIRNGNAQGSYPDYFGGGIRCFQSSPTLQYLIVENNHSDYGGGGICILQSTVAMLISNVKVINNTCGNDGGGIRVSSSYPTIQNCIISKNSSYYGGGIAVNYFNNPGSTNIINCTITNNTVTSTSDNDFYGGAGIKCSGSKVSIENSIIAFNNGDYGVSYYTEGLTDPYPLISYCMFWQNSAGNFHGCNPLNGPYITKNINQDSVDAYFDVFADPQFTDVSHNVFNVSAESPASDAGYNSFVTTSYDVNYSARIQNNRNLSQAYVNIGACETTSGVKPVLAAFKNPICSQEDLTINIQSIGSNFNWYSSATAGNPLFSSGSTISIDTLTRSTTLYIANTDSPLESARTAVTVNVIGKLNLSAVVSPNTFCVGANGSITALITPGIASDYKYDWYDQLMNPIINQTSQSIVNLPAGNYYVKATHLLAGCVSDTLEEIVLNNLTIPVINNVSVSVSASATCSQGNGKLQVTTITPGQPTDYTYNWYKGTTVDSAQVIANESDPLISNLSVGDYTVVAVQKTTGCISASASQHIFCITAVEPVDNGISVYPNPASSEVHILLSNPTYQITKVSIIDMTGQVLHNFETSEAEFIISRGNITSGLYFLQLSTNGQTSVSKLIYK